MFVRSLLSSIAFVAVALALSSQISQAADCSASISSFSLAGRGASGHKSMYLVKLNVGADVDIADFSVHSKLGHAETAAWLTRDASPSSSATASAWLTLPASDEPSTISLSSITKHGEHAPCVPPGALPTPLTSDGGATTVYDDSHARNDLNEESEPKTVFAHDANFSGKAQPNYPDAAKESGLMGNATVEVVVGPNGGRATAAWVRYINTGGTGDGTLLADAALWAAQESTFTPPTLYGRPQTVAYQIIYEFRLEYPGARQLSIDDTFNGCPLEIDNALVVPPTASDPTAWYFFMVSSQSGAVTSSIISVEDKRGHVTTYPWSAMTLYGPIGDEKYSSASAVLTSQTADIKAMWIKQATLSGGLTVDCAPDIDEPLAAVDGMPQRFVAGAASVNGIEEASPAHFTREEWPSYPAELDGKRAPGHVTVDGMVDSAGHVVEAFIRHSSGLDDLDQAAMNAATSSTYAPATAGAFTAFETDYMFVP